MPNKIMVLDLIEDLLDKEGNIIGKQVADKAGNKLKVKKGQGGKLASRWGELQVGKAYEFIMGEYKGYPYVENFEEVKNIMVKEAQKKVEDTSEVARHKSMAISYAKDLVVADKLPLDELLDEAEVIYRFIVGDLVVEDVKVAKEIVAKEIVAEEVGQEIPQKEPQNAMELMKWAASHGKEFTPSFVRRECNLGTQTITDEKVQEAYRVLKEKMGW